MRVRRQLAKDNHSFDPNRIGGYVYKKLRTLGVMNSPAFKLSESVKITRITANSVLIHRWKKMDTWNMVISGLVVKKISAPHIEGESTVAIYGSGAWFGEHSIVNDIETSGSYIAAIDSIVLQMPSETFIRLLETESSFSNFINKIIAKKYSRLNDLFFLQRLGNPLAKFSIGIALVAESLVEHLDLDTTTERVIVSVPQSIFASLIGISRSSFSEFISKFADESFIKTGYGSVEIGKLSHWRAVLSKFRKGEITLSEFERADFGRVVEILRSSGFQAAS